MEGLVPLGILAASSLGILWTVKKKKQSEHFTVVSDQFRQMFGPQFTKYVDEGSRKYNPLMNLANPMKNTLLTPGFTQSELADTEQQAKIALAGVKGQGADPTYGIERGDTEDIMINPESEGSAIQWAKKCESITTVDCNAFDDPGFANNCGICHEEGVNSIGKPKLGGLFVLESDKAEKEAYTAKMGDRRVNYQPSIGTCKNNRFSVTKEQCLDIQRRLECEKKQNFSVPGCSQCIQDQTFQYLDKFVQTNAAEIFVVGSGDAVFTKVGTTDALRMKLSNDAQKVQLSDFQEGDQLQITVSPSTGYIAGFLYGTTVTGTFKLDLYPMIRIDSVTQSPPRMSGTALIQKSRYTILRPGRGKDSMSLMLQNPFTFVATQEEEARLCPASPYMAKEESARLLDNSVCYKRGQVPGKFSAECLTSIFEASGCTAEGKAYPSSAQTVQVLQVDEKGLPLEIGEIAENITNLYNRATTGRDENGDELSMLAWSDASMKCLGKEVKSPCDSYNKNTGPLGQDCLTYLWGNKGLSDGVPGGLGPTYKGPTAISSLTPKIGDTYCTKAGTMSPTNQQGGANQQAIQIAQAKGGVEAVRQFYDSISRRANDNTLKDTERQEAMMQCYGIDLVKQQEQIGSSVALSTCTPATIFTQWVRGKPTNFGTFQLRKNMRIEFKVTPLGTQPLGQNNNFHQNLFQFSQTGNSCCQPGDRTPGFWFHPNSTRPHLYFALPTGNWSLNPDIQLPLNQESTVKINVQGNFVKLEVNGQSFEATMPSGNPQGTAQLWAPNPWEGNPGNCDLKDFKFCTYDDLTSVLTNDQGRSKSATASDYVEVQVSNDCQDQGTFIWARGNNYTLNPYIQIPTGNYDMNALQTLGIRPGMLSAVKIAGFGKVTLYSGPYFNGDSTVLTKTNDCLTTIGWNDRAKSMIVEAGAPSSRMVGVRIHCKAQHATGQQNQPNIPTVQLPIGRYDQKDLQDRGLTGISAVDVPPGMKATLFTGTGFSGQSLQLVDSIPCLVFQDNMNDNINSMIVEENPQTGCDGTYAYDWGYPDRPGKRKKGWYDNGQGQLQYCRYVGNDGNGQLPVWLCDTNTVPEVGIANTSEWWVFGGGPKIAGTKDWVNNNEPVKNFNLQCGFKP